MNRSYVAFVAITALAVLPGSPGYAQTKPAQPPVVGVKISPDDMFNAGVDLQMARKYKEAIAKYTEAIAKRKTFTDAYLNRSICYTEIGELDRAIADIEFYIYRKPNVAEGYVNRANIYLKKKEHDRAMDELDVASARNPRGPEKLAILSIRGDVYRDLADYDRAIATYTEYLSQAAIIQWKVDPKIYQNRGNAYMIRYRTLDRIGATAEARLAYEAAQRDFAEYAKLNP